MQCARHDLALSSNTGLIFAGSVLFSISYVGPTLVRFSNSSNISSLRLAKTIKNKTRPLNFALYDAEAVLSNPSAFKPEEIRTLRDQITSNLERAWELTGGSADELTGVMVQISQVVAKQFKESQ